MVRLTTTGFVVFYDGEITEDEFLTLRRVATELDAQDTGLLYQFQFTVDEEHFRVVASREGLMPINVWAMYAESKETSFCMIDETVVRYYLLGQHEEESVLSSLEGLDKKLMSKLIVKIRTLVEGVLL